MKFGDVMADILIRLIAQQSQPSLVGPQDGTVATDPMHADDGVVQEFLKLSFALLQRFLHLPAFAYLGFESTSLLLQEKNALQALLMGSQTLVLCGRKNVRVLATDQAN